MPFVIIYLAMPEQSGNRAGARDRSHPKAAIWSSDMEGQPAGSLGLIEKLPSSHRHYWKFISLDM